LGHTAATDPSGDAQGGPAAKPPRHHEINL